MLSRSNMRGYAFSELSFVQIKNGRKTHIVVPRNTIVLLTCAIADDEAGLWRILFGNQPATRGSRFTIRLDAVPLSGGMTLHELLQL